MTYTCRHVVAEDKVPVRWAVIVIDPVCLIVVETILNGACSCHYKTCLSQQQQAPYESHHGRERHVHPMVLGNTTLPSF